jgi:hypothetical protein
MTNSIQGHYRTTQLVWTKVAPYIRFRYVRALAKLPGSGIVYELGSGIGVGLNFLAQCRPDLDFVGLEMSGEAIDFGMSAFSSTPNLKMEKSSSIIEIAELLPHNAFLIALEVLEHLNDSSIEQFKSRVMPKLDECFFSFPYHQKNIEGTDHLQSFDLYSIFELFPGFETIFLRRGSIKFIGYWKKNKRTYLRQLIGISGESKEIDRISNCLD